MLVTLWADYYVGQDGSSQTPHRYAGDVVVDLRWSGWRSSRTHSLRWPSDRPSQ